MSRPSPEFEVRKKNPEVYQHFVAAGLDPWLADILARRMEQPVSLEDLMSPSIGKLADPAGIPDMDKAVDRIVDAIVRDEPCVLAVDHDLDGVASAAVLWTSLVDHFGVRPDLLTVVTSHRLTEGYGITEPVVARIKETGAKLVISADKGSSDQPRIRMLADADIDVVVTDHHVVPDEGPPASALACVNPARSDSGYDPCVCGAAVAFLTMAKVRTALLERGVRKSIPSLADVVDYVAVATIADCVALRPDRSYNNRALVARGLAMINAGRRPCWEILRQVVGAQITSEQIAFNLAPAVAAAGRLDWADTGFQFFIARSPGEAQEHWNLLQSENDERKAVERRLRKDAMTQVRDNQDNALVVYLEDGHSGVHGITASRLVEAYGKPAGIFSPKGAGARSGDEPICDPQGRALASGSFRSIDGVHIRDALQAVADGAPGLLVGFGGHAGAAGATIAIDDIPRFRQCFIAAVEQQIAGRSLRPKVWVDESMSAQDMTLETVERLLQLDPWGKDFPAPVFLGDFYVSDVRTMGDGTHLRLNLEREGREFSGVWFAAVDAGDPVLPVHKGEHCQLAYRLSENVFRGRRSLQLQIVGVVR